MRNNKNPQVARYPIGALLAATHPTLFAFDFSDIPENADEGGRDWLGPAIEVASMAICGAAVIECNTGWDENEGSDWSIVANSGSRLGCL